MVILHIGSYFPFKLVKFELIIHLVVYSDPFNVWLILLDKDGNQIRKFNFYDCRLTDISEITVSTFDEQDQLLTCTLTFDFMYMDFDGLMESKI